MTVEYDLPVLLDGTVASIEAKLPELTDAQLMALAELEHGGKTRATLLKAIDAELAGRADAAAVAAGAPLVTVENGADTGGNPDAGDSADGIFPDAPLPDNNVNDQATAQLGQQGGFEEDIYRARMESLRFALMDAGFQVDLGTDLILTATDAVTQLHAARQASETVAEAGMVPTEGVLAEFALSADADAETALIVMFEGASGRPIPSLGKLTFDAGDFTQDAGGKSRTLARAIVFPTDVAATEVCGVWLLDEDGEPWSRCPVIGRLPVGGGRQAAIPAHFLRFDAPATVKAAA